MSDADEAPTDAEFLASGWVEAELNIQADEVAGLPAGDVLTMVGELAPSAWPPALLCAVRRLDPVELSHRQLVDYVQTIERQKAYLEAVQVRALALLDRRDDSGC